MNLQRSFDRRNRLAAGLDNNPHPKVLDTFNNREEMREKYLHPRKGYRTFSIKRSKAAMMTAEMKVGKIPLAIFSWRRIKGILKDERAM